MTASTSEAARPRKQYAKSAAIRQRVIDACIDAFGLSGFHGATMKDIAARAGMSHTGLLHHFPSKESLLVAVLEYRDERIIAVTRAALEDLGDTPDNSILVLRAAVIASELEPGLAALDATLLAEATTPEHPAHHYFQDRFRVFRNVYRARFEEMTARGDLNTSMSPRALAYTFAAILYGLELQWLYEKEDFKIEDVFDEFVSSITRAPSARIV
ncbi:MULTISPECIES: TetR/AcrR family transcriptional regulator [unclassified Microbacterium]|uniref:TetR/AcrR family transcriptional regulator n=1 Tax=unclassified Microbacterium TaxID=2609290 RepID=UPI000EAA708F|nr:MULTISPECIES: TetR/AcrR family transcriptional regulator [unclassified Microbacterium]MBT2486514.1 TetR/AcrR family transcriptional regulator [Microbacterium sp. ISL-108]RKN69210.1 TetR/AcrR family transcriptional regulator [Microbacterium sp. CGR2]